MITTCGTTAQSATQTIRDQQQHAGSLAAIIPPYLHALTTLTQARHEHATLAALGPDLAASLTSNPAWPAVRRALLHAETAGWQPERILAAAARRGPLTHTYDPATLLAWRIRDITATRPAPAHLHQPSPDDAARYAELLALSTGTAPDPASMQHPPAYLNAPRRSVPADPPGNDENPAPAPAASAHLADVTAVSGSAAAERARQETTWPALAAALHRAVVNGFDPRDLLSQAAAQPGADDALKISEFLAHHINHYLASTPDQGPDALSHLAWVFKAAEHYGTTAESIIIGAAPEGDLQTILHRAQDAAHPPAIERPLPWLPAPSSQVPAPGHHDLADYITDRAIAISDRVRRLTDDTAATRPAWSLLLGPQPGEGPDRDQWLAGLAVISAYRDHYQTAGDDPAQVLGSYAGPGHAGHDAYWHAATAVHTAMCHTPPGASTISRDDTSSGVPAQVAIDTYNALPESERSAIAQQIAAQARPLWLGNPGFPDTHAVTQLPYTADLIAVLTASGYLTPHPAVVGLPPGDHVPLEDIRVHYRHRQPAAETRPATATQPPPSQEPGHAVLPTL